MRHIPFLQPLGVRRPQETHHPHLSHEPRQTASSKHLSNRMQTTRMQTGEPLHQRGHRTGIDRRRRNLNPSSYTSPPAPLSPAPPPHSAAPRRAAAPVRPANTARRIAALAAASPTGQRAQRRPREPRVFGLKPDTPAPSRLPRHCAARTSATSVAPLRASSSCPTAPAARPPSPCTTKACLTFPASSWPAPPAAPALPLYTPITCARAHAGFSRGPSACKHSAYAQRPPHGQHGRSAP